MKRRCFLTQVVTLGLLPSANLAAIEQTEWRGRAFGTDVRVTLTGETQIANRVIQDIPKILYDIETRFSLFLPNSSLTRLNRDSFLQADPLVLQLLQEVATAHILTNGLFDPTVQRLWNAYALGLPIQDARETLGWDRVTIFPDGLVRLAPGQELTLNGIAQGFASDMIKQHIHIPGIVSALIDIGEQVAFGRSQKLAIADPEHGIMGQRTLTDGAIATSSPTALSLGMTTHIIAPDGRQPVWSTVSIEAPSATLADALSTAAVFMNIEELRDLMKRCELRRITVIDRAGQLRTL